MTEATTDAVVFRPAVPQDAATLSAIAFRAKAHWGYSAAFMESCREELTVTPAALAGGRSTCIVAERAGLIVGFYALEPVPGQSTELDALFIEPAQLRRGIGSGLLRHAIGNLSARGCRRMVIHSDPHAAGFYAAAGAELVGETESGSVPGRMLPVFHLPVSTLPV